MSAHFFHRKKRKDPGTSLRNGPRRIDQQTWVVTSAPTVFATSDLHTFESLLRSLAILQPRTRGSGLALFSTCVTSTAEVDTVLEEYQRSLFDTSKPTVAS